MVEARINGIDSETRIREDSTKPFVLWVELKLFFFILLD